MTTTITPKRYKHDQRLRLAVVSLLLLLTFTAAAQAQYTTTPDGNGGLIITGYTGPGGAVTIPGTLGGLTVTGIGDNAFDDSSLTSVTIPASVTSIGAGPFAYCTSLTSITMSQPNSFYSSSVNGILYNQNQTTLVQYPGGAASSFTIPNNVTSIGDGAFEGCSNLTSLTIPTSVTSIGNHAFDSSGLATLTIPNSVTSIGFEAFQFSENLTSVTLGNGVTSIGNWAFQFDGSLTSVTIPASVTSIGESAFESCSSLSSVTIGNGVTSIGEFAFNGCSSLTSVTIGTGVTSIVDDAFESCSNLSSATFLGNAPTMGKSVFSGAAGGFTVYYENSATGFTSPSWLDSSGDAFTAVNLGTGSACILTGNLAFGNVTVNTNVTGTLTISNPGGVALNVSSISYPSGFSGNWPSGSVPAGGSQNVIVTFAPTTPMVYSGTITVNSSSGSDAQSIAVSGTANSAPNDPFGGSSLGGGWNYSSWFGTYNSTFYPWIYRTDLGFCYVDTTDNVNLYLYVLNGNPAPMGWLYVNQSDFPEVYSFTKTSWLYFSVGSTAFYNWNTGTWETY